MKKYLVYLDGADCHRIAVPARNSKEAIKYVQENGKIVAIKDVSDDYPIYASAVRTALENYGFGEIEIDFITRCLKFNGVAEE